MAPRIKVWCAVHKKLESKERERAHRRAATAHPYLPPSPSYPPKQPRVFGPTSEPDYNLEPGPSGVHSENLNADLPQDDDEELFMDVDNAEAGLDDFERPDFSGAEPAEPEAVMNQRWNPDTFVTPYKRD